ncbi:glycerophosphodiester phosphodiesterase family protein [Pseudolysinimonas sp.]|uniref:glycerophosphodiester phosphodiesterase family protein n=1 Tax=Pseudolysinimonas sp. TaxID=2680009 RepID=UPI003F7CEC7B
MAARPRNGRVAAGGWFAPALPRVIAHRGLAVEAPENTLLAFLRALATGVDYIETDVHASADGVAVISHDADLSRLTGRDVRVGQLTAAELARIDLGEGQIYATLAEALDAFPDARFNIDIKDPAAAEPAAAAILAAHATQRVLISSFSGRRRRAAVDRLPGVATSVSSFGVLVTVLAARLGIAALVRRALRDVDAIQIPQRVLGMSTTSSRVIAAVHGAGAEMHVWTINDPAVMRTLLERGVDGIITDRCDLAMDVVRRRA